MIEIKMNLTIYQKKLLFLSSDQDKKDYKTKMDLEISQQLVFLSLDVLNFFNFPSTVKFIKFLRSFGMSPFHIILTSFNSFFVLYLRK